jgi:cell volume regulation protein A
MTNADQYGAVVLAAGVTGVFALSAQRITAWTRIPAPLILLVASALASEIWTPVHQVSHSVIEDIVSIALIYILFDGGLSMGWRNVREVIVPISVLGVAGTFITAAGAAIFAHVVVGLPWYASLLLATAISPTDPAVVFSVLSGLRGRAMTVLAGESGANDPVGIALMSGLIAAGGVGWGPLGHVAWEFALRLGVGAVVGLLGGWILVWATRRMPMSSPAIDALRTALFLLAIFGLTAVAHGSGFLAVFIAGIRFGDATPPAAREIRGFHEALASLGEIVAFVVLGLTVDVGNLRHFDVWGTGLLIGVVLAVVIRPIAAGLCLLGSSLATNERLFVIFGGLKGAVPILLGTTLYSVHSGIEGLQDRLFGIVVIVVVFSVLVQGTLIGTVARLLGLTPAPEEEVERAVDAS